MLKGVLEEIKSVNVKLGYASVDKKMASTFLPHGDKNVPILVIRPLKA